MSETVMPPDSSAQAAADLLWRHWDEGTTLPGLPEPLCPGTRDEAYAIQAALEGRSARPLYGWKIAATSAAGQAHIGVDGPLAGRILAERVLDDGATLVLGPNRMRVAEPEFAFRMAADVPPRAQPYAPDEVLGAVATLHPAVEIPDSRYDDFAVVGAPQLIADNACARHFLLGAACPDTWRDVDLAAHPVTARVSGRYTRDGVGLNVLGDPRIALAWLINELSSLGITLRAGQVVTTGTCMVPVEIEPGDTVACDYGVLGGVSLRFAEA